MKGLGIMSGFKALQPQFSGLFRQRVGCDYVYDDLHSPDRARAQSAVDDARDLLGELAKLDEAHFKAFPWAAPKPIRGP